MRLHVKDTKGNPAGEVEVGFAVIEDGKGTQAVHDTVVAHLANRRSGTACTKTMGEVAGTGRKPWRQKGTGRARAGSFQSPLWRGGGVVFGPKPRDFGRKVNVRTRQLALRRALSERLRAGDVIVVEDLQLAAPKTKEFLGILAGLELGGQTVLVCASSDNRNLQLAARNVPDVEFTTGEVLNTYAALRYDKLLFTRAAFAKVEQRLK
jgi:large subunit ribosomal protein L4